MVVMGVGVGMIIVVGGSGSGSDGGSGNMIVGTEIAAAVMTAAVALSWFLLMCSKLPWQLRSGIDGSCGGTHDLVMSE